MQSPDWQGWEKNRQRPKGNLALFQTWHDLVFLHAPAPSAVLRKMIPDSLLVEEFDGSGWLGFVPFSMSGIRPPWFPALPWLSNFHETNLRTYVTHPIHGPGVWFFSLDAARYVACSIARQRFRLPYFHAEMSRSISDREWRYEGERKAGHFLPLLACQSVDLKSYSVAVQREGDWRVAMPETFEYWLVERYRLYSLGKAGQILTAQVHHEPYRIADAKLLDLEIKGLEDFGQLDFRSVLVAKTLSVECFSPTSA